MVDYSNIEMVQYMDEIKASVAYVDEYDITFNEAYPSVLPYPFTTLDYRGHFYQYDMRMTDKVYYDGVGISGSLVQYGDDFGIVGTPIYALLIRRYDDYTFTVDYINEGIGCCYYCMTEKDLTGFTGSLHTWVRLTSADVKNMGIQSPFTATIFVGGEDIYWLYNFGVYVNGLTSSFSDLLGFSIGKHNIVGLVVGSGFLVYMGWCLIKWAIPV